MYVVRADRKAQPIPQRLADHNPALKFFVVLRDPVKRTQSALLHQIWKGRLPATASPFDLLFGTYADRASHFGILEQGLYYKQLVPFLETFPIERFRFYSFERDLMLSPAQTLADAEAFLGLKQGYCTSGEDDRKRNRSVNSRTALRWNARFPRLGYLWQLYDRLSLSRDQVHLDERLIQELRGYFREDTLRLERELGLDLSHWRTASASNEGDPGVGPKADKHGHHQSSSGSALTVGSRKGFPSSRARANLGHAHRYRFRGFPG
jgi:hypothetical protein